MVKARLDNSHNATRSVEDHKKRAMRDMGSVRPEGLVDFGRKDRVRPILKVRDQARFLQTAK
jgi:hypothetical protein